MGVFPEGEEMRSGRSTSIEVPDDWSTAAALSLGLGSAASSSILSLLQSVPADPAVADGESLDSEQDDDGDVEPDCKNIRLAIEDGLIELTADSTTVSFRRAPGGGVA